MKLAHPLVLTTLGPTVMAPQVSVGALLGAALVLAIPVHELAHEAFRPYALRVALQGQVQTQAFELPTRQPLFLEYEVVVRAPGAERPQVTVSLNGVPATVVRSPSAFTTERGRVQLPFAAVRGGENQLRVALEPPTSATFDLRARVHNYFGIAPDFPRAAVVADEAVRHLAAQRSLAGRLARWAVVCLACAGMLWLLTLASPARARVPLLFVPSVVPWAALGYSLATPLHLWLSVPALLVVALVPWAFARLSLWVAAHRAAVGQVAAVTAVTLVMLEAGLRVFNYVSPTFLFYSESYDRYRGQPGARHYDAVLNSRGFNDAERTVTRPPEVRHRVVAIGDSFSVGVVPRRDNYLTLVEAELSADAPAEVINMGVSATEPRDYLSILVDEGLRFAPDLVLVGFYIGNDFETRAPRLHEYSFVVTLGRALWRLRSAGAIVAPPGGAPADYDDAAPTLPKERFLEIQVNRAGLYDRDLTALPVAAGRAAGYLGQMRDLSRRAGADLLVALIPDEIQIDPSLQFEVAQALGKAPGDFDFMRPNREIAQALAAADIPYVDLLPVVADAARQGRVYKPQDTHWNVAGNRVAAGHLAAAVRQRLAGRGPDAPGTQSRR